MKYYKSKLIYSCCGQYFATDKTYKTGDIICPRCNAVLNTPLKTPYIVIVSK